MLGYIDAILQRQDKGDVNLKMESFQIEIASRRSLQEILVAFRDVQAKQSAKIAKLEEEVAVQRKKSQDTSTLVKKFQAKNDEMIEEFVNVKSFTKEMDDFVKITRKDITATVQQI